MASIVPNVKNLEIGREYTYKELCQVLEEDEKTNREKQHQRWSRYFEFRKEGKRYIIVKIYDVPQVDGRTNGNNSKYIMYFKDIVMHMLTRNSDEDVYKTTKEWLLKSSLVNNNLYKDCKELRVEMESYIPKFHEYYIKNCQIDIKLFLTNKFRDAINQLQRDGYIEVIDTYKIILNDNTFKIAMPREKDEIEDICNEVLSEMKLKSLLHAEYKKLKSVVYKKIDEKLNEKYEYKTTYKVIGLLKTDRFTEYSYYTNSENDAKSILVSLICEGLDAHFVNKADSNKRQVEEKKDELIEKWIADDDISDIVVPYEYEGDYVDIMRNIFDMFLSL